MFSRNSILVIFIFLFAFGIAFAGHFTINSYSSFGGGGGGGNLLQWEMENTLNDGVTGTWTASAEATFNSSAPLVGSYSGQVTQTQDAGFESYQSPNVTYTAGVTIYGRFIFQGVTAWPTYAGNFFDLRDSGNATVMSIGRFADHTRCYQGTVNTENYSIVLATGTTYYVWFDYTPGTGSDGVAHAYIGTTGTKASATSITVATGDAQNDVQHARLLSLYNTGGGYHLYDSFTLSTSDPGDF